MTPCRWIWLPLCLLPAPLVAHAGEPRPEELWLFALAIGYNGTDDPHAQELRYADDDAVQNARMFAQLGAPGGAVLLTRLDADSRLLYPELAPLPPTQRAIQAALEELNSRIDAARLQGARSALYIFYSGHGDVEHNQGYVHLEDGRLKRDKILELLRASRADVNHLIVDACKSYFLVFDRGRSGDRRPVGGSLLDTEDKLPPNTGVLLSTSSAVDSHEWEAFGAGVFSHEVRSALRGAADLDGDGRITYEEAAAFIWTANRAIANRRFRPGFYSRSPRDRGSALLDRRGARARELVVDLGIKRRFYLEDLEGRRLADLHPGGETRLALVLPAGASAFVRFPDDQEEAEIPAGGDVRLSDLATREETARRRGAEHEAFNRLFSLPFDRRALSAYRERPVETVHAGPAGSDWTWLRRGLGLAAIALGATGGALTGAALYQRGQADGDTSGLERNRINDRISRYNSAAVSCYALAGAALAGYLLWTLWPEEDLEVQLMPADGPGVSLMVRF